MPGTDQKADFNFKQTLLVATTRDDVEFFSEPIRTDPPVISTRIWSDSSLIPASAPILAPDGIDGSGTVQYKEKVILTALPGGRAFYSALLKNAIPFNYDPVGSYNYTVYRNDGTTVIPFGEGDWVVDNGSGVLTFYGTVPSGMPPRISYYRYVGALGATLTGSSGIGTDVNGVSIISDGLNGTNPINVLESNTNNVLYVRDENGITLLNGANVPGGLSGVSPYGIVDNSANTTTVVRKVTTINNSTENIINFPSININRQSYAVEITAHGTSTSGTVGLIFMKQIKGVFCYPSVAYNTITNIGSQEGGSININQVASGYDIDITGIDTLTIVWLITIRYSQYRLPDI